MNKTTPAGPLWPSIASSKPKGKKTAAGTVKPAAIESGEELQICADPLPTSVFGQRGSKYAAKFEALPVGQCVKCSKAKTWSVAVAMRAWIKRTGREGLAVISKSDYGDGKGRVWLVKKEDRTEK